MYIPLAVIAFFMFRDDSGLKDLGKSQLCHILYESLSNKEYYPEESEVRTIIEFAKNIPLNDSNVSQQAK